MHFSQILAEFMDAPNEKTGDSNKFISNIFAVFLPYLQVCLFFPQTKKQQLARYPPDERSHIFCQGYVWVDDCPYIQGGICDRSLAGKIIVNVFPTSCRIWVLRHQSRFCHCVCLAGLVTCQSSNRKEKNTSFAPSKSVQVTYSPCMSVYGTCMYA